jgi:heptosyltransferase-2
MLTGQLFLVRRLIPQHAKRVLYIYLGTPNLGDSVMDLSPRVLWAGRGLSVEMYTSLEISSFYRNDPIFSKIITDPAELRDDYDFIVLQSYSWKCLKIKWSRFIGRSFVTLHGHYYGCEFDRLSFSCGAWARVLELPADRVLEKCKPIFNLKLDHGRKNVFAPPVTIGVALGGIVDWRIYDHWIEVIAGVSELRPGVRWVLLGSRNAREQADDVVRHFNSKNISDFVGKVSLDETFIQLSRAQLLIAADGGLLNLGRTVQIPMVGLFAREIHPKMRLAHSDSVVALHAPKRVSDISPRSVVGAVDEILAERVFSLRESYLGWEPECSLSSQFR